MKRNLIAASVTLLATLGPIFAQPAFTRHPSSQSVSLGADVLLTAGGNGFSSYQWLKDGIELSGAASTRLELHNVRMEDAGEYQLRGEHPEGHVSLSQPATLSVDPTFTKITTGAIVEDREISDRTAWGDFDGDGWVDLFVANYESHNALYKNNTDGTFSKITTGPIVTDAPAISHGAAWADFDNDGALDLVVANIWNLNYFYRNTGGGNFEKLSVQQLGAGVLGSSVDISVAPAWADFDQDGWLDLFVANGGQPADQPDGLYRNNREGGFEPVSNSPVTQSHISNQGVWADYDNDGDPDLFVTYFGSRNGFYKNTGGMFERVVDTPLSEGFDDSVGAAWGTTITTAFWIFSSPPDGSRSSNSTPSSAMSEVEPSSKSWRGTWSPPEEAIQAVPGSITTTTAIWTSSSTRMIALPTCSTKTMVTGPSPRSRKAAW